MDGLARTCERIAAYSFLKASDGLDIRLTASVGVACRATHAPSWR